MSKIVNLSVLEALKVFGSGCFCASGDVLITSVSLSR